MTRRPSCQVSAPKAGRTPTATRPSSVKSVSLVADDSRDFHASVLDETIAYRPSEVPSGPATETADDSEPAGPTLLGETLGQYRLEALVGQGSMGQVYRAQHLGLHRACALKVMNPGLTVAEPQIRERFWAEARAAANLLHPHVVTIHNLGCERGYHFIEMEYVRGGVSLRELVVRDGPLEAIHAAHLVRQVALALEAAHLAGLVHRDVKPANVLLNDQGLAKLADFGLVRRLSELEQAGVPIAGTPTYMAPELFEGVPASHRSDLYAVGVMLYYLLSARLPFASDQIGQLVQRHRHAPVPNIRDVVPAVPEAILPILERCLAKRPEERYASAADLASDLQRVITWARDTETLVRECVEGLDCFVQGGRDNFRVLFHLPSNRLQEVYVEVTQPAGGERLLSVFSVCGPADPRHYEFALRLNDSLTFGTLSIRNVQGRPMFVMNRTFLRDQVTTGDVRSAMLEIARRSDRVEHQLTDADVY